MLMLGCKPEGRNTEQHDVTFTIAEDFPGTEKDAKAFWPEAEKIHIDAYREVKKVAGYKVTVVPKNQVPPEQTKKLFFLNLGGYKPDVFDEFHYKMLIVADDIVAANKEATNSAFFLHHPPTTKTNRPHIDDKYGVDVDDVYIVEDILPQYIKDNFSLLIEDILFEEDITEDQIFTGYQKYDKLS